MRDDVEAFEASLAANAPPAGIAPPLAALWRDAAGDWDAAHELVAPLESDPRAAWVHAYLHRKEGDASNARYWYGRAGRPVSAQTLAEEWKSIVAALLSARGED